MTTEQADISDACQYMTHFMPVLVTTDVIYIESYIHQGGLWSLFLILVQIRN